MCATYSQSFNEWLRRCGHFGYAPSHGDRLITNPRPEGRERLSTWLDSGLAHSVKVLAAVNDETMREVVEQALREYLANHPVDAKTVRAALNPNVSSS